MGDAEIQFKFGTPTAPSELTNAAGQTFYYYPNAETKLIEKSVSLSAQIGSVTWSIAWKNGTTAEAKAAAATQTAVFTVNKVQDRIYFLDDNTAIASNAMAENFVVTVTVGNDGTLTSDLDEGALSGTLYFRVDGGAETGTIQNDAAGPLTGQTIAVTGNHDAS